MVRRILHRAKKWFKRLCFVVAIAVGGFYGWALNDYSRSASRLEVEEQRARRLGLPLSADELRPVPSILYTDNAAPFYRLAAAELKEIRGAGIPLDAAFYLSQDSSGRRWAETGALLSTANHALTLIVDGSKKPHSDFEKQWDRGPNVMFPELAEGKGAAKLLVARALLRARMGNLDRAISDLAAAARIGRHMGEEPILIGLLVNVAIDGIAIAGFEDLATYCKGDDAALQRIETAIHSLPSKPKLRFALRGEVFLGYDFTRNLEHYLDEVLGGDWPLPVPRFILFPPLIDSDFVCRAYAARVLEFWNDRFTEFDRVGWDQRRMGGWLDQKVELVSNERIPSNAFGVLSAILFPVFAQSGQSVLNMEARRRTIIALVRVLRFQAQNGRLPKTLAEAGVRLYDPFMNQPLKYRITGGGFRVYSVGPNGTDEKGRFQYEDSSVRGVADVIACYPSWERKSSDLRMPD